MSMASSRSPVEANVDDKSDEDMRNEAADQQKLLHIEVLRKEIARKKTLLSQRKQLLQEKECQLKLMQEKTTLAEMKRAMEKRELEMKLEAIKEKKKLSKQRQQEEAEDRKKEEKEKMERKKEVPTVIVTPVVTEEMQAEFQAQITSLKEKLASITREILSVETEHKDVKKEMEAAIEYGKDVSENKQELVSQIAELEGKLVEIEREQNKLLKEKEEYEEQLKLSKMANHCEKGNSMVAEIEDGNEIMARNQTIVNRKCVALKKKIALKSFELTKLKESHSNLLFDLKRKNNNNKSAYGVVQEEIDDLEQKIEALECKMENLMKMEATAISLKSGDDGTKYLRTMFTTKMKAIRDAAIECHSVAKQTFTRRQALFQMECEFRKLKSELRECQNLLARRTEDLANAKKEKLASPCDELAGSPHSLLAPSDERGTNVNQIRECSEVNHEALETDEKKREDLGNEDNGNVELSGREVEDKTQENSNGSKEETEGNSSVKTSPKIEESSRTNEDRIPIAQAHDEIKENDLKVLDKDRSCIGSPASLVEESQADSSVDKENIFNESSFVDEESLGKFKNVNSSLALGRVSAGKFDESSFIDEEALAARFQNKMDSSLNRMKTVNGRGRNILSQFNETNSNNFTNESFEKFRNSSSDKGVLESELVFANKENLASELMIVDKENLASELMSADKEN